MFGEKERGALIVPAYGFSRSHMQEAEACAARITQSGFPGGGEPHLIRAEKRVYVTRPDVRSLTTDLLDVSSGSFSGSVLLRKRPAPMPEHAFHVALMVDGPVARLGEQDDVMMQPCISACSRKRGEPFMVLPVACASQGRGAFPVRAGRQAVHARSEEWQDGHIVGTRITAIALEFWIADASTRKPDLLLYRCKKQTKIVHQGAIQVSEPLEGLSTDPWTLLEWSAASGYEEYLTRQCS